MKPRYQSSIRFATSLATAIAALISVQSTSAQNGTWLGVSGNWDATESWTSGNIADGADFSANFTGADIFTDATITLGANRTIGNINFTDEGFSSNNLLITGANTLTMDVTSGTPVINVTQSGRSLTIDSVLAGADGLQKAGLGTLNINGALENTITGGINISGGILSLDFNNLTTPTNLINSTNALQINNGALTINGKNLAAAATAQAFANTTLGAGINAINISKGALATSAALNLGALTVNTGSITTVITGTAGGTSWTTGILPIAESMSVSSITGKTLPTASGTSNWINVNAGLFYRQSANAGAARWINVDNLGNLVGLPAALTAITATTNDARLSFSLANSANIALTAGTTPSIYGLVPNASGTATLTTPNNGTLTLNGIIQVATGVTTINAGTGASNLIIGAERNLVINMDNTGGLTINAPIANHSTGASSVTIASTAPTGTTPGIVTLGGSNTFTGTTNISRSSLTFTSATPFGTSPGVNGTSGIVLNSGTALISARAGANPSTTITAPITLSSDGNTTLRIGQGAASNTHTFNLNGAISGATNNLVFTTTTGSFNNGTSLFVIGAAGTYTGNTLITTGNGTNNPVFLRSTVTNALPATTVLTFDQVNGGGTGRNFQFDLNGNNQTLAGLSNGGVVPQVRRMLVTNTSTTTPATLTINNTNDFTFGGSTTATTVGTAGSLTRAQIQGNLALVKNGSGTFTLGGTLAGGATAGGNTFTGDTTVLGGILVLGENIALQNSTFDTGSSIQGGSSSGLRAGIGGTGLTNLTLGGLKGNHGLASRFTTTNGGYSNLTELTLNPSAGVTRTFSGDIGDGASGLNLVKTGAGTQILDAAQSYSGTTTVNAGLLFASSTSALPGYNVAGKIVFNGGTIGVPVGGGAWTTSEVDTLLANATKTSGFLAIDTNNGNLTQWTPFTTTNFGALGLQKLGANDLTLNQANSYTGTTTVSEGTLTLNHENALQNSPLVTTGAGTVNLGSNTVLNLGGLSGATGNLSSIITNYSAITAINLNTPASPPGSGLSYSGIISDGVAGTTLTKFGSGIQALSGNNTYTGATQINEGILVFRTKASKSIGTATTAATGTIGLGVKDADSAFYAAADVDALFNSNTLSGFVIDAASGVALDTNGGSFDQTIALTAPRSLTKLGLNTLTLSQVNSYNGATIVNNGTLTLTGSITGGGAISTVGSSVFSQASTGIISGAATFTQGSTGISSLAGANTYTGVTTINLGQLTIAHASALGTTEGNTIITSGGRLAINTAGLVVAEPITISGTGTTTTNGAIAFGGGVTGMNLTGLISLASSARIQADGSTGSTISGGIDLGSNQLTINADGGATQTIDTNAISGSGGSLVKSGSGTLLLGTANSYTGTTVVNLGTLSITNNEALGTTDGSTTINGGSGTTGVTLTLSNALSNLTIAEPLRFAGSAAGRATLNNTSSQNHTLSGPIDVSSDTTLTQFFSSDAGSITITGDITGTLTSGAGLYLRGTSTNELNQVIGNVNLVGGLFKTDAGTWLIGAPGKTYNWENTGIAVGRLKMGLANVLPATTIVTFGNSTGTSTPILDLNGFNQTVAGIVYNGQGTAAGTRTITSASPATLTIQNNTDFTTTGTNVSTNNIVITGAVSLIKQGAGKLALNGNNTYSGDTTVSAGTLELADNAKLKFTLGASAGSNNSIGGTGTLLLSGDFDIDTTAAESLTSGTWNLVNNASLEETYSSSFSVEGFTDVGDNKWEKTIGSKKYTFDEVTGTLTLGAAASYASWIDGFFPGETNPTIIGATADPDKDGVANAVEMVLGGNPATSMDNALLPTIELVTDPIGSPVIPAGNYILFTFRRTDLSVTAGVTAACEIDGDLVGSWTPASSVPGAVIQVDDNFTFTPAAPNTDRVRVYVPRSNSTNFGRLNVQVP